MDACSPAQLLEPVFLSLFLKSDDRQSLLQIAAFQEDELGSPAQVSGFQHRPPNPEKKPLVLSRFQVERFPGLRPEKEIFRGIDGFPLVS